MKETEFKERLGNIVKEYESQGFSNVEFLNTLRHDRMKSLWYGGDTILSFTYGGKPWEVNTYGDVRIRVLDEDGNEDEVIIDKNNVGINPTSFTNDDEYLDLSEAERIQVGNSNWFELQCMDNSVDTFGSESVLFLVDELFNPGPIKELCDELIGSSDVVTGSLDQTLEV